MQEAREDWAQPLCQGINGEAMGLVPLKSHTKIPPYPLPLFSPRMKSRSMFPEGKNAKIMREPEQLVIVNFNQSPARVFFFSFFFKQQEIDSFSFIVFYLSISVSLFSSSLLHYFWLRHRN